MSNDPFWDEYTPDFYLKHAEGPRAYATRELVRAVRDTVHPRVLLDVGCGPGVSIAAWMLLRVYAEGVDSEEAKKHSVLADRQFVWDLREKLPRPVRYYDTLTCWEVAEHLPPERGPSFVEDLCGYGPETIVWSAARVGQGGTGHINERPLGYWRELFLERGYAWDEEATARIVAAASDRGVFDICPWYERVKVLRRDR